jgi:hypothetical protein
MVTVGKGGVHLVHGHGVHARHLVLLFPFHPAQNYSTLALWYAWFQHLPPPKKTKKTKQNDHAFFLSLEGLHSSLVLEAL